MMRVYLGTNLGSQYWGEVPQTLTLAHRYHKANDRGGPVVAEVEVTGPIAALWEVLTWLRRPVEILDDFAVPVWWGMVNEVRLTDGVFTYAATLDGLYNRVAVAYTEASPDGGQDRLTTAWAEDSASVTRYGAKELVYSYGQNATQAQAEGKRDLLLAKRAKPTIKPSVSMGDVRALLVCTGWYETLKWKRFERLEGRVEHDGENGITYPIGWRIVGSTNIGMYDYGLQDLAATLGGLEPGHVVVVDSGGSPAYNDGPTTVLGNATSDGVQTYTANTIFFDAIDDIYDNAQGIGFLRRGEFFTVSGSAQNSQVHLCEGTGAGYVTVTSGATGAIVGEAVGPTITINQGHKVEVATNYSLLVPGGGTFTVKLRGERVAQSFVPGESMTVTEVALKVGKSGSPADQIAVDLCANSSGDPGTVLATALLTGSQVPSAPAWTWWTFAGVSLTAGTTYWIVVRRTGGVSATSYWPVQMTTDASGSCRVYDGATWYAEPAGQYLPFKVWAGEDTGVQMGRILADCGQFFNSYSIPATGITSNPHRDGDMDGLTEFEKLLGGGDSSGNRLVVRVTRNRSFVVTTEPLLDEGLAVRVDRSGSLWRNTTQLPAGYLPAGEWCLLDVPESVKSQLGAAAIFVSESQFDDSRGWSIVSANGEDDLLI